MTEGQVDTTEFEAELNYFEDASEEVRHFELTRHPEGECDSCDTVSDKLLRAKDAAKRNLISLFVEAANR